LLSTASFLHAQSDSIENFHPIGDFVLEIDEKPVPTAEFYLAEHKPAVLILVAELPGAVVLLPGDQTVHMVPSADVTKKPDGFVDIGMDSAADQGNLQILAAWIRFSVEGHTLTLKERPWLLGEQEIPAMENHNPEYVWRSDRYNPNTDIIQTLAHETNGVRVWAFFGSWCPHCKHHLPLLMKVNEALSGSPIEFDYYGLPRGWTRHPVAGPLKITSVPTAIVYVDGKEVGRITGNQWETPEIALKKILFP
jgi:thiol-disulfide isomerase/thioredoxin